MESDNRQFMECALQRLFVANKARLFTLKKENVLVACDIVLRDQNWFYCYMTGLNGDYLKLSPGVAVLANIIRVAIADEMYGVDLTWGNEAYKYKWANSEIQSRVVGVEYLGIVQGLIRSTRNRVRLRSRAKLAMDHCLKPFLKHSYSFSENDFDS
jgi:CelD/BcsL family acetyltransferase involved in cellulose biosynthesis